MLPRSVGAYNKPLLVALDARATEPVIVWMALLIDLAERGVSAPLPVISDGSNGLSAAIERHLTPVRHQRCTIRVYLDMLQRCPSTRRGALPLSVILTF